ncbi:Methyltransferase domain protein [Candidatus Bilamarchaeum dharawalense]|uniref:Methyltransferase domain protein n=1 Tax=Candidatus Bilamarchaeum dharawalense TaxID=2885759 RepID=A0A5E4LPN8_9ARCH|nr:Methyltransferase domain protein [Candidatus Bilamarchaeum dharawalense]
MAVGGMGVAGNGQGRDFKGPTRSDGPPRIQVATVTDMQAAVRDYQEDKALRLRELAKGHDPKLFAQTYATVSAAGLFDDWVGRGYSSHMRITGHDSAVVNLINQALMLHRLRLGNSGRPIFGKNILEMSVGTGLVIDAILAGMTPDERRRIRFTGNDLSVGMQDEARTVLGERCNIQYTQQDIRAMTFERRKFQTAILSQTLPFITDPELLYIENTTGGERSEHRAAKLAVIKKVSQILKQYGIFLMIDEWPTVLTRRAADPVAPDIVERFGEIFRPITDRGTFRDRIMNNGPALPSMRFLAELKARIDKEHSMYLFIYFNDPDKVDHRDEKLSDTEPHRQLRDNAVERLIQAFKLIDMPFRDHHQPINGESATWAELAPMGEGPVYDSREAKIVDGVPQFPRNGKYNTVIIAEDMHVMDCKTRLRFVKEAVDNLNVGGTLLIVDEWSVPANRPHPVGKKQMRDEALELVRERLVFEGALRESIKEGYNSAMYGYAYRKRF